MAHIRHTDRPLTDQPDRRPTRKVSAGALGGAVVTLAVAIAGAFDVTIEPEVSAAVVTVLTFVASFLVRDRL